MDWLSGIFSSIWGVLKRGWDALRHLRFADIWNAIKRALDRFRRALQWYHDHILAPLERMRQTIMAIYIRWFRPVIQLLESLRTMVRFLALFDRRLAALIDAKLTWLENLVMTPITAALKRINSLSSYMRAILTPLGMLDRVLLIESIRRDAAIIWDTITNPQQAIHDTYQPPATRLQSDRVADFSDFVAGRGGYYQTSTDALTVHFVNLLGGVE